MSDPEVIGDRNRLAEAGRAFSTLEPAASARARSGAARTDDLAGAQELLDEGEDDAEVREMLETARGAGRRARGGDPPRDGRDGPQRRQGRDRRDPRGRGRRRGRPVGGRPVPDAHQVRRAARLQDRHDGRLRRLVHVRDRRRRRVLRVQVRGRHAPRPARAGDRVPGPHPHVDRDGRRAAGGRGGRRHDRPERPADRRLPLRRARAASRSTRRTPPCASPTSRRASPSRCRTRSPSCRTARRRCACCARGSTRPSSRASRPSCPATRKLAGRHGRARGEDPHLQLPRAPGHRPPHQAHGAQPRRDPAGRARRLHRRAAGRREAPRPRGAGIRVRPDPRRERDAGVAGRRCCRPRTRHRSSRRPADRGPRRRRFADYAGRACRDGDVRRRPLDGRHHRLDRRGRGAAPGRSTSRRCCRAPGARWRSSSSEMLCPAAARSSAATGLDYFDADDAPRAAGCDPARPARPGGRAVLRACSTAPTPGPVHRLPRRPRRSRPGLDQRRGRPTASSSTAATSPQARVPGRARRRCCDGSTRRDARSSPAAGVRHAAARRRGAARARARASTARALLRPARTPRGVRRARRAARGASRSPTSPAARASATSTSTSTRAC